MTDERYNGWANYPTWNVALWLDNDEGLYGWALEMAEEEAGSDTPRADLADRLRDFVRDSEMAPNLGASMYADMLGWALDCVDWHEIADHYLEDVEVEA